MATIFDTAPELNADFGDDNVFYDVDESLFDFDFTHVEPYQLGPNKPPVTTSEAHKIRLVDDDVPRVVHKPTKGGVVKLKRKPNKRTSRMLQGMVSGTKVPNMSRRSEGSVLVAFPTFDKCDSLVFLPSSFTRLMNNADIPGMTELIRAHTTKNCDYFFKGHKIKLAMFLGLNEISTELHPDAVSCVSVTKVVNNTVQAKVFTKFTECDPIFQSVAVMRNNDPTFNFLFGNDPRKAKRIDRWRKKVQSMNKDEDEKEEIISTVMSTPGNLLVYGSFYMTFTFDDASRKVSRIDYDFEVTSLTRAPESVVNIGHA